MSNIVKYNLSTSPNSIQSGNFNVGVNNTSTDLSGFYNGISPIIGGYTIYINKASNGPSIYSPKNDTELIQITNRLGASVATAADALVWINSQSTMTVINNNYPSIVTSGLVMNLDAGFVSSYPKTGTTWKDLSGNNYDGTLVNGPTFSTDGGGSIAFDGTDDYVSLPINSSFNTSSITFEVWANLSSTPSRQILMVNWQGISLEVNADRSVVMYNYSSGGQLGAATSASIFNWGSWTHFIGVYDNSSQSLKTYINGVLQATRPDTPSTIYSVGVHKIAGTNYSLGIFGNVAAAIHYNRALTDNEVQQNYYAGLQRLIPTNGLVLSLDAQNTNLYAVSPTTSYDVSGNDNNGTLTNGVGYVSNGNGSWNFDGADDEILVNNSSSINFNGVQQYTVLAWVYPNLGGTTWHGIVSKGESQQYALTINSPNAYLHYETNQGGVSALNSSANSVDLNQWQLVGIRFDGSTKTIWKNGVSIASQAASSLNSASNTQQLRIGEGNSGEQFRGGISQVQIYNRALTQTEITTIYNATKSRYGL